MRSVRFNHSHVLWSLGRSICSREVGTRNVVSTTYVATPITTMRRYLWAETARCALAADSDGKCLNLAPVSPFWTCRRGDARLKVNPEAVPENTLQ